MSRLIGATFEGHEQEAMKLFQAIEASKLPARGKKILEEETN